ncbi:hypothetical protein EZV62_007175 [Acer yangbiense]|uniref:Retroviral polymerase SH3-like domain-containing protein n=1 Tax=Acer yangbiense TaxID=1000413 RepID=A0A5C7I972_9ROSI|nr:hypothetical protein EZV62_007175 [Acer yangbiense]
MCPTLAIKDVTPDEAWSGVKPLVDHFRVFGCIAHVHVPEERRTKLDNRSITCVLLGVSEESKGYRLFDPVAKRVVVSRDVIFEEEKQWDWDVSYENQIVVDLEWGDGDGENEEGVSENGNGENTDGEVGETRDEGVREKEDGSSEGEERVRELRQSRERQPPTWMGDYVCGEGLFEDEVHMALVVSTDPLCFEEAVKSFKISKDGNIDFVDETYYKQLVGSLMYLIATRPDMMFVTCLISRYMAKPMEIHLQAAKRALRYLKGTVNYGIHYKKGGDGELLAFTDSDYAGDMEDRKSTSGYVFLMSSSAVSWCSKKQPIVTLSTTEAEFVAATVCACQGVWMKRILKELGHSDGGCTTIMCDNSSTIKLSKNLVMHGRSKHIDVRFHFLRNLTKDGTIELVHCGSQDQVADIMTKPLKLEVFQNLRKLLGVCEISDIN